MVHNLAGWTGAVLILLGYFLNSTGMVTSNSSVYQLINLFGACGILWNAFVLRSLPVVYLNMFWMGIAIHSLLKIYLATG